MDKMGIVFFKERLNHIYYKERNLQDSQLRSSNKKGKSKDKPSFTLNSRSNSFKLNPFSYFLLRLKQFFFGHKLKALQNLKNTVKLKKKVFNELTIYKMFFDIEKLKTIFLDPEQQEAFQNIKLDFKSLFGPKIFDFNYEKTFSNLAKSENIIDQKLAMLLKDSQ